MVGKVTSQGDRMMRAQVARRNFHLDGRGIQIGVISDSFNALEGAKKDVISGDLPGQKNPYGYTQPVRVLKDLKSGSDEGRAMLQIITDIAPGAELLFHTVITPRLDIQHGFARAVKALVKAGADIIVDDIGFPSPLFQDGLAARTVTEAANQGVVYFSAIGNDGNRSYTSTFRPNSQFTFRGLTYEAHNFATSEHPDLFQDVSLTRRDSLSLLLGWDQPSGKITSDLELFLVANPQLPNAGGKLLATSITQFSGRVEQALEQLDYEFSPQNRAYLVIARKLDGTNPSNQIKWISTANDGDSGVIYEYVNDGSQSNEPSTIYGQPNAEGAIAVGAAQISRNPLLRVKPPMLEDFSSRGGTPILLDAQGNRLSRPEIRQKPEIIAPNGVKTTLESFDPFFGTSAAAPHAAGVAALIMQRAGGSKRLSPAQIADIMQQTAFPIDQQGNFRSGAGLLRADAAVLAASTRQIRGTRQGERLPGRSRADTLLGFRGNDQLRGGQGSDALLGGGDRDILQGNAGNDYLVGDWGSDRLLGGAGSDTLLGNRGRDDLSGHLGDDLLAGGAGRNHLVGGDGQDLFVLSATGKARIADFQAGRDQIGLDGGLRFEQMRFIPQGNHMLIQFRQQTLAQLLNVTEPLTAATFTTIAIRD